MRFTSRTLYNSPSAGFQDIASYQSIPNTVDEAVQHMPRQPFYTLMSIFNTPLLAGQCDKPSTVTFSFYYQKMYRLADKNLAYKEALGDSRRPSTALRPIQNIADHLEDYTA